MKKLNSVYDIHEIHEKNGKNGHNKVFFSLHVLRLIMWSLLVKSKNF